MRKNNNSSPMLGDPPEVIRQCMTCRKDTCDNCMAYRSKHGRWKERPDPPKGVELEKFVTLYNVGVTCRDMSEILGVSFTSIRRFLERCNLPFASENRPLITTEDYWRFKK